MIDRTENTQQPEPQGLVPQQRDFDPDKLRKINRDLADLLSDSQREKRLAEEELAKVKAERDEALGMATLWRGNYQRKSKEVEELKQNYQGLVEHNSRLEAELYERTVDVNGIPYDVAKAFENGYSAGVRDTVNDRARRNSLYRSGNTLTLGDVFNAIKAKFGRTITYHPGEAIQLTIPEGLQRARMANQVGRVMLNAVDKIGENTTPYDAII